MVTKSGHLLIPDSSQMCRSSSLGLLGHKYVMGVQLLVIIMLMLTKYAISKQVICQCPFIYTGDGITLCILQGGLKTKALLSAGAGRWILSVFFGIWSQILNLSLIA